MNCPNCGAALDALPNRSHFRCDYCKTLHFPEAISEGVILLDREHQLNCPCCERKLADGVLDGGRVGLCPDCRGILLSSDHFSRVVSERRALRGNRRGRIEPFDPGEFRRMIRCPKCADRVDTHTYGGGGNAVIDSCPRCRLIWLDAGELTVLEEYGVRK